MCAVIPFILDVRLKVCGRTSRGHTGFLHLSSAVLALIFLARRIQPFLSLIDCEVECCMYTNELIVLPLRCWVYLLLLLFIYFWEEKSQFV